MPKGPARGSCARRPSESSDVTEVDPYIAAEAQSPCAMDWAVCTQASTFVRAFSTQFSPSNTGMPARSGEGWRARAAARAGAAA